MRPTGWFVVAGALVLGLATAPGAAPAHAPATVTIVIEGARFVPDVAAVHVGDRVVWVNKDPYPHTATSRAGGFDSHRLVSGASWTYTPAAKGDFPYVCTLHPSMKATLRVQ